MCVHLPLHFDWVVMIQTFSGFACSAGRIDQVCDHLRHTTYKLLPNFIFLHLTQSQRKANKYITKLFICFLTKSQTIVKYKKNNKMMLLRRGDLPFIFCWIYANYGKTSHKLIHDVLWQNPSLFPSSHQHHTQIQEKAKSYITILFLLS